MNFATPTAKTVKSTADNFYCRICNVKGYSSLYCPNFVSFEERKKKCIELGLCTFYASLNHATDNCPGKADNLRNTSRFCKSNRHIGTLCPTIPIWKLGSVDGNVCLNTKISELSNFLLPFMSMFLRGPKGPKEGFDMLIDTGSTRPYLSAKGAEILNHVAKTMKIRQYKVRTFLGCGVKQLKKVTLEMLLPAGRYAQMPILIDDDFKLEMNVRGLNVAVNNLKKLNYRLAADFDESSNHVPLEGLIDNDIL